MEPGGFARARASPRILPRKCVIPASGTVSGTRGTVKIHVTLSQRLVTFGLILWLFGLLPMSLWRSYVRIDRLRQTDGPPDVRSPEGVCSRQEGHTATMPLLRAITSVIAGLLLVLALLPTPAAAASSRRARQSSAPHNGWRQPATILAATPTPTEPAEGDVRPGIIGATTPTPAPAPPDNRWLLELMAFILAVIAACSVFNSFTLRRRGVTSPWPMRGPGGDRPDMIPEAEAAKIYDLGMEAERRRMR